MGESNQATLVVGMIAVAVFVRNMLFADIVLPQYAQYPYKFNINFIRCANAYYGAKGKKPFYRMMLFNTIRAILPEALKQIAYKNTLVIPDLIFSF